MKLMPLYHVRHFKGTETHTLGKFTSKEEALKLARRFIKNIQSSLEEAGTYSIVARTDFTDEDTIMVTITDAKHNPIGDHDSLSEGVSISLFVPQMTPETEAFFKSLH